MSETSFPSAPLQYRWKGVEAFSARVWRGRKHHQVIVESHEVLWPDAAVAKARQQLDSMDPAAATSTDAVRYKSQVRGGLTVDFLRSDTDGIQVEKLILLQSAAQGFLNKCFSAEAAVTAYSDRLLYLPVNCRAAPDAELAAMRQKAIDKNLHILSGDAGMSLLSEYSRYFSFDSDVWKDWNIAESDDAKFHMCLDLVVVTQDAYLRLVFKCDLPSIEIFEVCNVGEGVDFNLEKVQAVARSLKAKYDLCSASVDRTFTLPWATRLLYSPAMCRKAHTSLRNILSVLRVTSARVERKHLVGQELVPTKRGAALECSQLGKTVFRKLVTAAGDRHRSHAYSQTLGTPATLRHFSQCLTDHCCQSHEDRRTTLARTQDPERKKTSKIAQHEGKSRVTKVRAYDMYIRSNYSSRLEGNTTFEKRKTLDASWKALSDPEKAAYQHAADRENDRVAEHEGENFPAYLARMKQEIVVGSHAKSSASKERFRAIQVTLDELINHPVFSSGARIHDFGHGIRPELINAEWTISQARDECSRLFDYDAVPIATPNVLPRCFSPCTQSNGGFCCTSELLGSANTLTYNVYARCKRWKDEFPILLEFASGPTNQFLLLGRLVGAGKLAVFSNVVVTHVAASPGCDAHDVAELVLSRSVRVPEPTSIPMTSHKFFRDFLVVQRKAQVLTHAC